MLKVDEDEGLLNLLTEEPSIGQLVCNNLERIKVPILNVFLIIFLYKLTFFYCKEFGQVSRPHRFSQLLDRLCFTSYG